MAQTAAANTATVLIADGDPAVRSTLRQVLGPLGHFVVGEAGSGAQALAMTRTLRPNIIFLAAQLSEIAQTLAMERIAPVIVMAHEADAIKEASETGAMAFLSLPARGSELGAVIRIALARFREITALENEIQALKERMESRKLVGRAKAILMERQGFTEREAFRRIQAQSAALNKPVHEIAQAIIVASEIPT